MKIGEFIKVLSAIDDINDVVVDVREGLNIPSEEGMALHKEVMPVLKDLIGKFLGHAEKYMKVGD